MEISDDESEDGQITKTDQEEEKVDKLLSKASIPDDQPMGIKDLETCRLTRDMLAKYCLAPWFEDYVQGMLLPWICPVRDSLSSKAHGYGILLVRRVVSQFIGYVKLRVRIWSSSSH